MTHAGRYVAPKPAPVASGSQRRILQFERAMWREAPAGKGRGVGLRPRASIGRGVIGLRPRAGKGRGVGLRPHASKGKDPKGNDRGCKSAKDGKGGTAGKGCKGAQDWNGGTARKGYKGAKDGKGGTAAPAGTASVKREKTKRGDYADEYRALEKRLHRHRVIARRSDARRALGIRGIITVMCVLSRCL